MRHLRAFPVCVLQLKVAGPEGFWWVSLWRFSLHQASAASDYGEQGPLVGVAGVTMGMGQTYSKIVPSEKGLV